MIIQNIQDFSNIGKQFYIYGSGSLGIYNLNRFNSELPDVNIVAFIDDFKKGILNDKKIIKFEEIDKNIPIIITSSYSESISKKLKNENLEYYISDLLNFEREQKITKYSNKGIELIFYTPNQFLFEVVNNIEIIEPKTLEWINNLSDKVFYDIGASNGVYSIFAALKNKVISIEPDISNTNILDSNIKLNNLDIIPFNLALSESKSILSLSSLEKGAGFHGKFTSNSNRFNDNSTLKSNVMAYDLDSLILDFKLKNPTHIKIDVDGAEESVLKGMYNTLKNDSLEEILIEIEDKKFNEINNLLLMKEFKLIEKHKIAEITGIEISGTYNYLYRK